MKITSNLTHVATEIEFEAPLNEEELLAVFEKSGVQGFPAELDIAERTEDHVQMMSLDGLLGFAKASGLSAVTYDVTYFPHADDAEVAYQLRQLARDLEISAEVIRDVCAAEIQEYLALDAKRDAGLPVHSIVDVVLRALGDVELGGETLHAALLEHLAQLVFVQRSLELDLGGDVGHVARDLHRCTFLS